MSSALFLLRRTPEYSIAQPEIACRNYRTVAKVFLLRPDKKFSGIKISLFGVLSFTASALFFAVISLAKNNPHRRLSYRTRLYYDFLCLYYNPFFMFCQPFPPRFYKFIDGIFGKIDFLSPFLPQISENFFDSMIFAAKIDIRDVACGNARFTEHFFESA